MKDNVGLIDVNLDLFYTAPDEYRYKLTDFISDDMQIYEYLILLVTNEKNAKLEHIFKTTKYKNYINLKSANGDSVLHIAIFIGNIQTCKILLDNGADINMCDADGYTCWHRMVFNNNPDVVDLLTHYDIDMNKQDKNGNTLLHLAVIFKNFNLIDKIIKLGVDTSILNDNKYTALDCALDDEEIINIFNKIHFDEF